MPDFGIFRGFGSKLFSDKLYAGQLPTQLGLIGSENALKYLLNSYPNAAVAYSLRLLNTAYTGSAIRVRRSSDNTEQNIGFVGENLDTAALSSFCGSGNGFVTTWYDQSGNARNATQTTAANQPQIVSNGTVLTEGSKPTLRFDVSNDYFEFARIQLTQISTFTSVKRTSTSTYQGILKVADTSVNNSAYFLEVNSEMSVGPLHAAAYPNNTARAKGGSVNNNVYRLISSFWDGLGTVGNSFYSIYDNAVQQTLSNTVNIASTGASRSLIGANYFGSQIVSFWGGTIQEVVIYNSNQSSNRTGIESNINTYYGIY
jgi:hypothetical protein